MHNNFKRFGFVFMVLAGLALTHPSMAEEKAKEAAPAKEATKEAAKAAPEGKTVKITEATPVEQAEFAVNLFMQACLANGGDKERLRKWVKEVKLPEVTGEDAKPFLSNTPSGKGLAWSASGKQGRFVLVSEDNGACTIYSRKADEKKVHEMMKWMKDNLDKNKGEQKITYELRTENDKEQKLKRTLIAVRRPDMGNDIGMVATTSTTHPSLAAIISIFAIESGAKM